MWREGIDLALIAWVINAIALAFGAGLGARAFFDPRWAQRLARLKPDEQGGGFAEFRATYGGVFLALHAVALAFSVAWILGGEGVLGVYAAGAAAAVAACWAGSAVGRALSMWRDGTRTRFNAMSAAIEAVTALAIGAPWLSWVLGLSP
jgi:hypothetical protein